MINASFLERPDRIEKSQRNGMYVLGSGICVLSVISACYGIKYFFFPDAKKVFLFKWSYLRCSFQVELSSLFALSIGFMGVVYSILQIRVDALWYCMRTRLKKEWMFHRVEDKQQQTILPQGQSFLFNPEAVKRLRAHHAEIPTALLELLSIKLPEVPTRLDFETVRAMILSWNERGVSIPSSLHLDRASSFLSSGNRWVSEKHYKQCIQSILALHPSWYLNQQPLYQKAKTDEERLAALCLLITTSNQQKEIPPGGLKLDNTLWTKTFNAIEDHYTTYCYQWVIQVCAAAHLEDVFKKRTEECLQLIAGYGQSGRVLPETHIRWVCSQWGVPLVEKVLTKERVIKHVKTRLLPEMLSIYQKVRHHLLSHLLSHDELCDQSFYDVLSLLATSHTPSPQDQPKQENVWQLLRMLAKPQFRLASLPVERDKTDATTTGSLANQLTFIERHLKQPLNKKQRDPLSNQERFVVNKTQAAYDRINRTALISYGIFISGSFAFIAIALLRMVQPNSSYSFMRYYSYVHHVYLSHTLSFAPVIACVFRLISHLSDLEKEIKKRLLYIVPRWPLVPANLHRIFSDMFPGFGGPFAQIHTGVPPEEVRVTCQYLEQVQDNPTIYKVPDTVYTRKLDELKGTNISDYSQLALESPDSKESVARCRQAEEEARSRTTAIEEAVKDLHQDNDASSLDQADVLKKGQAVWDAFSKAPAPKIILEEDPVLARYQAMQLEKITGEELVARRYALLGLTRDLWNSKTLLSQENVSLDQILEAIADKLTLEKVSPATITRTQVWVLLHILWKNHEVMSNKPSSKEGASTEQLQQLKHIIDAVYTMMVPGLRMPGESAPLTLGEREQLDALFKEYLYQVAESTPKCWALHEEYIVALYKMYEYRHMTPWARGIFSQYIAPPDPSAQPSPLWKAMMSTVPSFYGVIARFAQCLNREQDAINKVTQWEQLLTIWMEVSVMWQWPTKEGKEGPKEFPYSEQYKATKAKFFKKEILSNRWYFGCDYNQSFDDPVRDFYRQLFGELSSAFPEFFEAIQTMTLPQQGSKSRLQQMSTELFEKDDNPTEDLVKTLNMFMHVFTGLCYQPSSEEAKKAYYDGLGIEDRKKLMGEYWYRNIDPTYYCLKFLHEKYMNNLSIDPREAQFDHFTAEGKKQICERIAYKEECVLYYYMNRLYREVIQRSDAKGTTPSGNYGLNSAKWITTSQDYYHSYFGFMKDFLKNALSIAIIHHTRDVHVHIACRSLLGLYFDSLASATENPSFWRYQSPSPDCYEKLKGSELLAIQEKVRAPPSEREPSSLRYYVAENKNDWDLFLDLNKLECCMSSQPYVLSVTPPGVINSSSGFHDIGAEGFAAICEDKKRQYESILPSDDLPLRKEIEEELSRYAYLLAVNALTEILDLDAIQRNIPEDKRLHFTNQQCETAIKERRETLKSLYAIVFSPDRATIGERVKALLSLPQHNLHNKLLNQMIEVTKAYPQINLDTKEGLSLMLTW